MQGRKRVLLGVSLSCFMVAAATAQLNKPAPALALDLNEAADVTFKKSGEVRVWIDEMFIVDEVPYRMSVTFRDFVDYESAKLTENGVIELDAMATAWIRNANGIVRELPPMKSSSSFLGLARSAHGTVCGDVVARGVVRYAEDRYVGVSLHAGSHWALFGAHAEDADGNASSSSIRSTGSFESKMGDSFELVEDVHDQCDVFAFGGCGGPQCTSVVRYNGEVFSYTGQCTAQGRIIATCFC